MQKIWLKDDECRLKGHIWFKDTGIKIFLRSKVEKTAVFSVKVPFLTWFIICITLPPGGVYGCNTQNSKVHSIFVSRDLFPIRGIDLQPNIKNMTHFKCRVLNPYFETEKRENIQVQTQLSYNDLSLHLVVI